MSRINLGAKPCTTPQPVWILAAYDENGVANAMNAAWVVFLKLMRFLYVLHQATRHAKIL